MQPLSINRQRCKTPSDNSESRNNQCAYTLLNVDYLSAVKHVWEAVQQENPDRLTPVFDSGHYTVCQC